jgi:hypothetical protein
MMGAVGAASFDVDQIAARRAAGDFQEITDLH